MYYGIPFSQYDLLLRGNVGYKGMDKKIDELTELCRRKKCYFFSKEENINEKDEILLLRYIDFYNYIRINYVKVDSLLEFDFYTNFVK